MTWTSAFGKGSGWLLQKIVNGLALTRISPNVLTFLGLVINIVAACFFGFRSEEHTSELQSRSDLVCRLLLEKKKTKHHFYKTKNKKEQKRNKERTTRRP